MVIKLYGNVIEVCFIMFFTSVLFYNSVLSSAQEMAALFPDRVIAIKGTLEGMSQAESAISAKLAECIEQDQAQSFVRV